MDIIKAKRDAILNVLGLLFPTAIFLILTPVMIDSLGTDGFGVIVIIQIVTGYMNILNFGFAEAVIKHVAENVKQDMDQAVRVMWVGLALFSTVGLIGGALIFFLAPWLGFSALNIPDELRDDSVSGLKLGSLIFFLQMIAEFYRGSALGCGRFDIPNISRIVRISISAVLIIYALNAGGGIIEVMLATLAGLVIGLLLNIIWMQRVLPLHHTEGGVGDLFRELFHFSKHIFISRLCGTLSTKIPHFFLGSLGSISSVALFEVPVRVADAGTSILNRILQVFYPGFSSMDKETRTGRIRGILFSVISIQLFLLVPVLLMVVLEGQSLLALWIDNAFAENVSQVIVLIVLAYFLKSVTNLPFYCAMSMDKPEIISKYSLIQFVITLVILYPLISEMGLLGAAWVLFIPSLGAIPFVYEIFMRLFGINVYRKFAPLLLTHAAIGIGLYATYEYIYRQSAIYSPLGVLALGALYWLIAATAKALSKEDRRRLFRLIVAWP